MKPSDVGARAFAMPLTSPAFPPGPCRFVNRDYMIITCRTAPDRLREGVPEPLQVTDPVVKFDFIRMPDSTGSGAYTENGWWGLPRKFAKPAPNAAMDTLVGEL